MVLVVLGRIFRAVRAVPTDPEVCSLPDEALVWGDCSLSFRVPSAPVRFRGLSVAQRDAVAGAYRDFVDLCPPKLGTREAVDRDVECRAYRLTAPLQLTTDALTRDGEYTPLKVRTLGALEVTGANFEARIGIGTHSHSCSLGVAQEQELAQCDVIENFLRVYTAYHALLRGGVVLHSAGLVFDEQAYIFVGRSGAGKTTLTRKAHPEGARVLSDDLNLVLPSDDGFDAFAVPFSGEFGRTVEQPGGSPRYPVAGLVLLERGSGPRARAATNSEAVARLLVGSPFVNADTDDPELVLDVLTDIARRVPVVKLLSGRDDSIGDIMTTVTRCIHDARTENSH